MEKGVSQASNEAKVNAYRDVIKTICNLHWSNLSQEGLTSIAWVYYFFSIQFCETVGLARILYPNDKNLEELDRGERDTDNLSPYPGVVETNERVDHCEFMRRTLELTPIEQTERLRLESIGKAYLILSRSMDPATRAVSLPTYEDGGLEQVFRSILKAQHWDTPLLKAFKHFLDGHITLDSDPELGHGSLCRFLSPTAEVFDLWTAFGQMLVEAAPELKN
ncbi:hypothetical protein DSM21852_07700 [Methylocystis bryophila]|uniref:Uncharacterized protein n=2 Tax=Methylocystis bryophila TaxID=655015 RepID=A0A1W6MV86_9HYPH|nr:hypothetical protein B1812_10910 [Methylocystis bryophila]BDV37517.1 hypothetical protein DSM21852_07700 [Methylocystis bryophila]